jgi:hypothetical protein
MSNSNPNTSDQNTENLSADQREAYLMLARAIVFPKEKIVPRHLRAV